MKFCPECGRKVEKVAEAYLFDIDERYYRCSGGYTFVEKHNGCNGTTTIHHENDLEETLKDRKKEGVLAWTKKDGKIIRR